MWKLHGRTGSLSVWETHPFGPRFFSRQKNPWHGGMATWAATGWNLRSCNLWSGADAPFTDWCVEIFGSFWTNGTGFGTKVLYLSLKGLRLVHQRVTFLIQQVVFWVSIFSGPWTNFTHGELHIQAEIEVAGRQKKPDVEHQVPVFVLGECFVLKFRLVKIFFFLLLQLHQDFSHQENGSWYD